MTEVRNSLPKSHAEPGSQDPSLDQTCRSVSGTDGDPYGGFAMDNSGELGMQSLLSRPPAPQGRVCSGDDMVRVSVLRFPRLDS
jgi:hypothetical protein